MAARSSRRPAARSARLAADRPAPRGVRGPATMPFDRRNYVLLLAALGLIVVGYALMLVDNATNDNPVDSALSLYVAPLLLLAGYLGVAGAVLTGVPRESDAPEADAPAPQAA